MRPDEQDGCISTPTRTVITQISEMGVMYRKVTAFTKEQEKRKGMTEQVRVSAILQVRLY